MHGKIVRKKQAKNYTSFVPSRRLARKCHKRVWMSVRVIDPGNRISIIWLPLSGSVGIRG